MLTQEILRDITPDAKAELIAALLTQEAVLAARYSIDTPLRMAHFLAQTAHELAGFTTMLENLNYRVAALTAMFGHRITAAQAAHVGRDDATGQRANQDAIADIIYGGTWGATNLGNTQAGDGSRFKGRGLIQITGRSNYTALAGALGKSLDDTVAYLSTPNGAVESAGWFWKAHHINTPADADDINGVTKLINPGLIGLDSRKDFLESAKDALPT